MISGKEVTCGEFARRMVRLRIVRLKGWRHALVVEEGHGN